MSQVKYIAVRNKTTGEVVQVPASFMRSGTVPAFKPPAGSALLVRLLSIDSVAGGVIRIKKVGADLVLSDASGDLLLLEGFYDLDDVSLESIGVESSSGLVEHMATTDGVRFAHIDDVLALTSVQPTEAATGVPLSRLAGLAALVGAGAAAGGGGGPEGSGNGATNREDDNDPVVTPTIAYQVTVALGPLTDVGLGSKVLFYRADTGVLLGESTGFDDGRFVFNDASGYTGMVLARLVDGDADADYRDEASSALRDIGSDLWVAAHISGTDATVSLVLSPLSTLAVMKALGVVQVNDIQAKVDSAQVSDVEFVVANQAMAALFIGPDIELAHAPVQFAVTPSGQAATPNGYGTVLAVISTIEHNAGMSSAAVLQALAQSVAISGDNACLVAGMGAVLLREAAQAPQAGGRALPPHAMLMTATDALALTVSLHTDSGISNSDGITNSGTVNVGNLGTLGQGTSWAYSTDGGNTWATGSGSSFVLQPGSYTAGAIQVRLNYAQGSTSAAVHSTGVITIDTTAAAQPSLALSTDTGVSTTDGISSVGTVTVSGLENGSSWQYSTNSGNTWTTGAGSGFVLAPGSYAAGAIQVRQTDAAGNTSAPGLNAAAITIDTTAVMPTLTLNGDTVEVGQLENGASWQYSTDNGRTWVIGSDNSFVLAEGSYTPGSVQARQTDAAGNASEVGQLAMLELAQLSNASGPVDISTGAAATASAVTLRFDLASAQVQAGDTFVLMNGTVRFGPSRILSQTDIDRQYLEVALNGLDTRATYQLSGALVYEDGLLGFRSQSLGLKGTANTTPTVVITEVRDVTGPAQGLITAGDTSDAEAPHMVVQLSTRLGPNEQLQMFQGAQQVVGTWTAMDTTGKQWLFQPAQAFAQGDVALSVERTFFDGTTVGSDVFRYIVSKSQAPVVDVSIDSVVADQGPSAGTHTTGAFISDDTVRIRGTLSQNLNAQEAIFVYDGATLLGQATVIGQQWHLDTTAAQMRPGAHRLQARVENTPLQLNGEWSNLFELGQVGELNLNMSDSQPVWSGRYVMLRVDTAIAGSDNSWNPSEIRVYSGAALISQGATVTGNVGDPGRIIDGDTANWLEIFRSNWLQIDLGESRAITAIDLIGRSSRSDRLKGSIVFVSDTSMASMSLADLKANTDNVTHVGTVLNNSIAHAFSTATTTALQIQTIDGTELSGTLGSMPPPNSVVRVYRGDEELVSANISGRHWSALLPDGTSLPNGQYDLHIQLETPDGATVYARSSQAVLVNVLAQSNKSLTLVSLMDDTGAQMGNIAAGASTDDAAPTVTVRLNMPLAAGEKLLALDGSTSLSGTWRPLDTSRTLWQFELDAAMSAGAKQLQVRWLDAQDAVLTNTEARAFTVAAPANLLGTTSTLVVNDNAGEVQGAVATGSSTDDTTPRLSGQLSVPLAANEVLRVYSGNTLLGAATPNGSGAWTYDAAALPPGQHRLQARVENTATGQVGEFATAGSINVFDVPRVVVEGGQAAWAARYILLRGDAAGLSFVDGNWNPSEAKIYSAKGVLISQGKATSGISDSARFVNGDTSDWLELSRSSWVQIDLGAVYEIGKVELFGRSNRADRMQGTMVFASDVDMAQLNLAELQAGAAGVAKLGTVTGWQSSSAFYAPATTWFTRDTTPTISGDLASPLMPDESLAVYVAGNLIGTAQVSGSQWTFTVPGPSALAVGTHALTVKLENTSGTSFWSKDISLQVAAPLSVSLLDLALADNVGVATGDFVSRSLSSDDTSPQLKGTLAGALPPATELVILKDGLIVGRVQDWTTETDGRRSWRHTLDLSAGAHELSVGIQDLSTSAVQVLDTIHYKLIPPNAPTWLQSTAHGVLPVGVDAVGDNLQVAGILGVTLGATEALHIYLNGQSLGSATVGAGGHWSFNLPSLLPGQNQLHWQVVSADANGQQTLIRGANTTFNAAATATEAQIRFNAQQQDDGWVIQGRAAPGTEIVVKWGHSTTSPITTDASGLWTTTFYVNESRFGKQAPLGINDLFVYQRDPFSGVLTEISQFNAQVDIVAPELLMIQADTSQAVAGQVVHLNMQFTERPVGLDVADFHVLGGTLHNLTINGTQATADLLVDRGLQPGQMLVGLKMGGWTDLAGNPGANSPELGSHLAIEKLGVSLIAAQHTLQPLTQHFTLRAGASMALDLRDPTLDLSTNTWSVLVELPTGVTLNRGAWDSTAQAWRVLGADLSELTLTSSTAVDPNALIKLTYQHTHPDTGAWTTHSTAAVVGRFVPYVGALGSSEDFNNYTRVKEAWNDGLHSYSGKDILINVREGNGDSVPSASDFLLGNVLYSPGYDGVWAGGHGYGVMQRAAGSLGGNFRGAAYNAQMTFMNGPPLPDTDIINRSVGAGSTLGSGWYDMDSSLSLRSGLGAIVLNSAGNAGRPVATERTSSKAEDLMSIGSLNNANGTPIYDYGDANHVMVPGWGGTSHASPLVAGLSALVLEANSDLGFRDVQSIVAYSARYLPATGGGVGGFELNGARTLNGAGLHYSHRAGFGVFDAQAAVALARDWLKPQDYVAKTAFTNAADPTSVWRHAVGVADSTIATVSATANVITTLNFNVADDVTIESIRFKFLINANDLSKMQIILISPSGTQSILMSSSDFRNHSGWAELTSRRFWGESSQGQWQVQFFNSADIGTTSTVSSPHIDLLGVKNETDQRHVYTDEWQTTYNSLASSAIQKQMGWLADQDGGNDSIYLSALNSNATVTLGTHGYIDLQGNRVGLLNAAAINNVFGGRGDDRLVGQVGGGSLVVGNDGADRIVAIGAGNTIDAGAGADWVWFSRGDQVKGGEGADKFVLASGNWSIAGLQDIHALVSDFDHTSDTLFRYNPTDNSFEVLRVFALDNHFEWAPVNDASMLQDLHAMRLMTPQVHIDAMALTSDSLRVDFNQTLRTSGGVVDHMHFDVPANNQSLTTIDLSQSQLVSEFGRSFAYSHLLFGAADTVELDAQQLGNGAYLWASSPNTRLLGGAGNDVLVTQDHNGGDQLRGGTGADRFVWKPGAQLAQGVSQVLDFNAAEGDVLDISQLLVHLNLGVQIDNHLNLVLDTQHAYLNFDLGRNGSFADVFSIQLVGAVTNGSIDGTDTFRSLYLDQTIVI